MYNVVSQWFRSLKRWFHREVGEGLANPPEEAMYQTRTCLGLATAHVSPLTTLPPSLADMSSAAAPHS